MTFAVPLDLGQGDHDDPTLFARIADDLGTQGYSIQPNALTPAMCAALCACLSSLDDREFADAGVGRQADFHRNRFIRTDEICWIDGTSDEGRGWLNWAESLKTFLNRRLFMGLFSFESHFAHYEPGSYYKRHYDAFRGESNRMLSMVAYLNADWQLEHGGELVLYRNENDRDGIHVLPRMGTLVLFLSEEFPHEVKPAQRDRHSIAGWFRVNTTHGNRIDPPR